MSGKLTTHVLDTARGKPASGLDIGLFKVTDLGRERLKTVTTNLDGRCDEPLLQGDEFAIGEYELVFDVGSYYGDSDNVPFLGQVPVRFGISEQGEHYHVPLLVSPFGYSTYRGS